MSGLTSAAPLPAESLDDLPHRAPTDIALSLVSHTNAGKTTLARTLLRADIGEVRDAPHVTEFAEVQTMIATPEGERLLLWDTPGFGDSVRLVKRLRQSSQPIGWLLSQVWDRWRDRPFWASQQAMRNLRDEADVMLYLVNAAESPEAAGYVAPEMELLAWVGKPVIALLNQLGPPGAPALEAAELARWRSHLASHPAVRAVLPLDAFARCWVQEATLLHTVEQALDGERRAQMGRLRAAWRRRDLDVFDAAMHAIAEGLARAAMAAVPLPDAGGLGARLRSAGARIGLGSADPSPVAQAQETLARQLDAQARADTQALIRLHGLEGSAEGTILARLVTHYQVRLRMDEGQAALWGGVLSGALVGLKADLLSGGLTLGGGLLAGGLLGALGSAGVARCVNLVRGTESSWLSWNGEALDAIVEAALLRYLAVAHFGRGRGDWAEGESPVHWKEEVAASLAPQREALASLWGRRPPPGGDADDDARESGRLALRLELEAIVREAARSTLSRLYPEAGEASGSTRPIASAGRPRSPRRMGFPQSAIEFWFDFSSPYSYIASEWIEALAARHGRTVRWKAMLLGVTFQAAELRSPVAHPIKRDYTLLDFERSAHFAGVPYSLPDPFPIPTQNAARLFWWLADERPASAPSWARHCLRAYFTRNVNLADAAQLKALAAEFGIDGDEAEGVWSSPVAKARLRQVCDDAVAHGVFGAPFFIVDGEPFWGNDRRGQIERRLKGGSFQVTAHGDL